MQNHIEIQGKAFHEVKEIINQISMVNSVDDFLELEAEIQELKEFHSFFKTLKKYSTTDNNVEDIPLQIISGTEQETTNQQESRDFYVAEEEVIFNNELNEIEPDDIAHPELNDDVLEEEAQFNNELNEIEPLEEVNDIESFDQNQITENETFEQSVEENEILPQAHDEEVHVEKLELITENQEDNTLNDIEEHSDTLKEELLPAENENNIAEDAVSEHHNDETVVTEEESTHDKKIKLANIRALNKTESLFDDEEIHVEEKTNHSGIIAKNNVPTDYLEAEKPKQEFRLDLNDKIAFSQKLFGGSQSELNETINQLNTFKTLEEAKEFLSEIYYEKKWENVDEYAQRLWSLVENKFM